jgi:hypothetical protein
VTRSVLLAGALSVLITAPAWAADVLIYGPADSTENGVATTGGHTVTTVDATAWAVMTTDQFAAFDAIVIGDSGCTVGTSPNLDAATTNRTTWAPAITGPIVVSAWDPGAHGDGPGGNLTDELTLNNINYASSGTSTGLYFALACYYLDNAVSAVTLLDPFGVFSVNDQSADIITILDPASPTMTGLTEAGLSNWGNSTHAQFLAFPGNFTAIANSDNDDGLILPVMVTGQVAAAPTPTPGPLPDAAVAPTSSGFLVPVLGLLLLLVAAVSIGVQVRRRGDFRQD